MRFLALLLPAILVIAYFAWQAPEPNPASTPAATLPRVLAAVVSEPVKLKHKRHSRTEPALTADGANLIAAYILAGGAAGGGLPFPLLPR